MKLFKINKFIAIATISFIIVFSIFLNKLPYIFCNFISWLGYCEECNI